MEFGDLSNLFYDDSDIDIDDSSFNLSGITDNDTSYWDKAWDMANTPTGAGLIQGAAQGLSSYYQQKSNEDNLDKSLASNEKALADKIATRAAHNASINKPFSGAKKVRYNGKL